MKRKFDIFKFLGLLLILAVLSPMPAAAEDDLTTTTTVNETTETTETTEAASVSAESIQTDGIIGSDEQKEVKDTRVDPYRQVVRIEFRFGDVWYYGSGAMIGPDTVLTAAHNLYNNEEQKWADQVIIIPAQNDDEEPYGRYDASMLYILKGYQEETEINSGSNDVGVVKLSQPVDSQVGQLSVSTEQSQGLRVQVPGYPSDSEEKSGKMYTMIGPITALDNRLMEYEIDTEKGQSGSPVLNEKKEIVGVHILGYLDKEGEDGEYIQNAARRIQEDVIRMIEIAQGGQDPSAEDGVANHQIEVEVEKPEYPVYRLYHPGIKRHLYTQDENEVNVLSNRGWNDEGEKFITTDSGTPVYRLYSSITKEHLFTTNKIEHDILKGRGWSSEGIAWYSEGSTQVYRLYHSGLKVHLFTSDTNERFVLLRRGWQDEKVAWNTL